MEKEIRRAVDELKGLTEDVTTSDLQGMTEARAMAILRAGGVQCDVMNVLVLSDEILRRIYDEYE